jgi:hypothetical protein
MTSMRRQPAWPGGMKKETVAAYCDIQPTYVDQLVKRGLLPRPRICGEAHLWNRADVDKHIAGQSGSEQQCPDPYERGLRDGTPDDAT